jgi:5-methylthioadenosine/S-adenosylhomocysteine deaminase
MASSLICGKYVICKALDRTRADVIEDGAVFQRDGVVVEVGKYAELAARHRADETLGSDRHVVIPGLVNSHHHVGLTPFQLGSPDLPLELWFGSRMALRDVDLYLDTLYSAFEMIESGVTTVQHLHGARLRGPIERIHEAATSVLRAYGDIGMRASYSFAVRDQNRLVYEPDEQFVKRLPAALGAEVAELLRSQTIPLEDNFALFEQLQREHAGSARLRIQLAPHNLHWCSDAALSKIKEHADKHHVPIHMHLLETRFQKAYAGRRSNKSAVGHLADLGLLGPALTLGHGVWMTEADVDLIAESRTMICHNASSNMRLRSGMAPLNYLEQRGVRVAIGMDEAGINDDRDMLQEMRLVLRVHRVPGMADDVPTAAQVLRMATEHGACTTPFGTEIGTLEAGKAADLCIMNWEHIAYPYLDTGVPIVDAVVYRARSSGVETVLVGGEAVLCERRFTRIDKQAVLQELAASLKVPRTAAEARRIGLSEELLPHMRRFYEDEGYLAEPAGEPYYRFNSRN